MQKRKLHNGLISALKKDKCFLLGTLVKKHGISGDILVKFHVDRPEDFMNANFVFVEIEEQPVPFFIEKDGIRLVARTSGIIRFDGMMDQKLAGELVGCNIYLPDSFCVETQSSGSPESLIGFEVYDPVYGRVGEITGILRYPKNPVLQVAQGNKEALIPFSEDIITAMDTDRRIIEMHIPEGLLGLYF